MQKCTRCFRNSHLATECYALTTLYGKPLDPTTACSRKNRNAISFASQMKVQPEKGVYVLALRGGKYYVGLSDNIHTRIQQHMNGTGSAWTRLHPPVSADLLPPLAVTTNDGATDERNETLHRMHMHGIDKVRGYKWTTEILTPDHHKNIQEEIAEIFQLCRACFKKGHFIRDCPSRNPHPAAVAAQTQQHGKFRVVIPHEKASSICGKPRIHIISSYSYNSSNESKQGAALA